MGKTDPPEAQEQIWGGWSGRVALDVGAHTGESVEDLVRSGFTDITCFEPSPIAFQLLEEHVSADCPWVRLVDSAVSDHDGEVDLAATRAMDTKGELVSPTVGMEWSVPDWNSVPYISVPCVTLDTWCSLNCWPDFVKVDTEGHEVRVLEGARALLRHGCGWLIEFHSPDNQRECKYMLEEYGYEPHVIRHPHYMIGTHMYFQHGWVRADRPDRSGT